MVVGAEVADLVAFFFGGAFVVEGYEAGEDFLLEGSAGVSPACWGRCGRDARGPVQIRPAIGFEDGGVEIVVELLEDGDEALVVDGFFFGVERLSRAELFQDVVHARERERRMHLLLPLAVRVQTLTQVADALLQFAFFEGGEGEGLKASSLYIDGCWAELRT